MESIVGNESRDGASPLPYIPSGTFAVARMHANVIVNEIAVMLWHQSIFPLVLSLQDRAAET